MRAPGETLNGWAVVVYSGNFRPKPVFVGSGKVSRAMTTRVVRLRSIHSDSPPRYQPPL